MSARPARQVRAFPGLRNELLGEVDSRGLAAAPTEPLSPRARCRSRGASSHPACAPRGDKGCSRRPRRSTETRRILVSFPDKAT